MTASKHRWFRLSLLTMFVVITAFGCWLGWQINFIRNRVAFVEMLQQRRRDKSALLAGDGGIKVMGRSEIIQQVAAVPPKVLGAVNHSRA